MDIINSFSGDYRFLSNFYPAPIKYGERIYPSSEHVFVACKCPPTDKAWRDYIAGLSTPGKAKRAGNAINMATQNRELRPGWDDMKVKVMAHILSLKFAQHADLRAKLLNTGHAYLIEGNTWNDTFWGMCSGVGQNWLGKLLMEERTSIRVLLDMKDKV